MKLKLQQLERNKHEDMVVSADWTASNELLSVSDDRRILRWSIDGAFVNEVISKLDPFVTDIHCQVQSGQMMALAQSNGQFLIASIATGKVEVTAPKQHQGSITCIRWSSDGSTVITAGEDGKIYQWSRSGNLRCKLVSCDTAIYTAAWSPDNQAILYASGNNLVIKPMRVDEKQIRWRTNAGLILTVDWSAINDLIVCGGEFCRYCIFNAHGQALFVSKPLESPITSVRWAPNGTMFAVGALDTLLLCDQSGWVYSRDSTSTGSILSLSWTLDGTHLAGACVNGVVLFGQVVNRMVRWKQLEATLNDQNQIIVTNILIDLGGKAFETLDFGNRVIEFAIGYGHLVIATSKQLYSYNVLTFSTPNIFDIKDGGTVHLILLNEKFFVVAGNGVIGLRVYSYEGRELCNIRVPGLQTEFLKSMNIAISSDTLALIDRSKGSKSLLFLDIMSGAPLGKPISCPEQVVRIALSQQGLTSDRKIVWIDTIGDLWLSMVHGGQKPVKIATLAKSALWHSDTDALAAMVDTQLRIWYYPNVVFVDKTLLEHTTEVFDEGFGRNADVAEFTGNQCIVRRQDGALVVVNVLPYPALLFSYASQGQWAAATALARFVNEGVVWSCLGAMAIHGRELATAEQCLAAIDSVDKLHHIQAIKALPVKAARDAELALFRKRRGEAEQILLSNNLVYRAIELSLRLCNWRRALELAQKYSTHIDTVLGHRQRYLERFKQQETLPEFTALKGMVKIDWGTINANQEKDRLLEGSIK